MAQQVTTSVENNFTKGLITEATGLSFPENAAFDTDNCIYTLVGDVVRREGFDYEANFEQDMINRTGLAMSTYKWNNVGGDGSTQIIVRQIGSTLYFFQSSNATAASPLSTTKLLSTISIAAFLVTGSSFNPSITECQFTDGNGYLFVFHPNLTPFYCTFVAGAVTATSIDVQIRDQIGIVDSLADSTRPSTLSNEHKYNLQNQGWTSAPSWATTDFVDLNINFVNAGNVTFTVDPGLPVVLGQVVIASGTGQAANPYGGSMTGSVVSYSGTTLVLNIFSVSSSGLIGFPANNGWNAIFPINTGLITTWHTAEGNYPSNSDIWWRFKDTSNVFNPATTQPNITVDSGPAPKGFYKFSAFNQDRTSVSGITGLTVVNTNVRPRTGTWFQGRVWYAGVDGSFPTSGDAAYYTWTENIYFSQIVSKTDQFGKCHQTNDPTSEDFFDLLPSDGGVIVIQGSGAIYKLFPIQNGLLVFAANGIWFITGSQGIGFSANDYTITKISGIQAITSNSFINVMGYPVFWNEEGIYIVSPNQTGSLSVNNLTLGTILSFYNTIPLQSKKFARGDYNPVDYIIQWCFRSTNETSVTDRYEFDRILNYNTSNKAFYPYSVGEGPPHIHGINYVAGPGGSSSPPPTFKYLTSTPQGGSYAFTFSEERDDVNFLDWFSINGTGVDYVSYFVTGYRIKGLAQRRYQPGYIYLYLRNDVNNAYSFQGIYDFAIDRNSNRFSSIQTVTDFTDPAKFNVIFRRHKVRGRGLSFQMKVSSVTGRPFDVIGWSIWETQNTSV